MDQAQNLRNVIKVKNQSRKLDARVITVTSGKGGVGKSNVAVNLAVQISKMGKKGEENHMRDKLLLVQLS